MVYTLVVKKRFVPNKENIRNYILAEELYNDIGAARRTFRYGGRHRLLAEIGLKYGNVKKQIINLYFVRNMSRKKTNKKSDLVSK